MQSIQVSLICLLVSWASAQYGSGNQSQWNSGSFSQSNSGSLSLSSSQGSSLTGGIDSTGRFIMAGYMYSGTTASTMESVCVFGSGSGGSPGPNGQQALYGQIAKGMTSGGTFMADMVPTSVSSGYTSGELRNIQMTPGTPSSGSVQTICGSYTYSYTATPSTTATGTGYGSYTGSTGSGNGMPGTVSATFSYSGSFGNWSVSATGSMSMGPDHQSSAYSSISLTNTYSSPTGYGTPQSYSGCLTRIQMDQSTGTFNAMGHIAGQPLYANGMVAAGMFATQSLSYSFPSAGMTYLSGSYSSAGYDNSRNTTDPLAYVNFQVGGSSGTYLSGVVYGNNSIMSSGATSGTFWSGSVMPSGMNGENYGIFSISGMVNYASFQASGEYGNGCAYASQVSLTCGAATDYSAALTNTQYPASSGMGIGCATVDPTGGSFSATGAYKNFNGGVSTFDASGMITKGNATSTPTGSSQYTISNAVLNVDGSPVNQEINLGYMSYGSVNGNVGPATNPVASFYGSAMGNTVGLSSVSVMQQTGMGSGTTVPPIGAGGR